MVFRVIWPARNRWYHLFLTSATRLTLADLQLWSGILTRKLRWLHQPSTTFVNLYLTPRSTVRNPYARDTKVEGHTQIVSRSVLTPQGILADTIVMISWGRTHDMSSSIALTPHNPKQLFYIATGQRVSIFHMKLSCSDISWFWYWNLIWPFVNL